MSRVHSRLALVAAAVTPLAVACSSSTDPSANVTAPLSASEAGAVGGLLTQALTSAGQGTLNSDGSRSFACPKGGTVKIAVLNGDGYGNSDGTLTVVGSATITPQACVVGTGTRQITITGDPSERAQTRATLTGGTPISLVTVVTGGFKWDGGSCQVNFTSTTTGLGMAQRQNTVVGTVCGQSVNTTTAF